MSTFLFSVLLETSAPVEAGNMKRAISTALSKDDLDLDQSAHKLLPLNLVNTATVHPIPLPADVEGITAHALVEIVRLKEQKSNLQIALHGALDLLQAPGDILQAQANGDVEKVAHWIAEQARK